MLQRIRLAMQDDDGGGKLGGEVEVDETFIGGKARNMHKRSARARGIIEGTSTGGQGGRHGPAGAAGEKGTQRVRLRRRRDARKHSCKTPSASNVEAGATVYTDALQSYERPQTRLRARRHRPRRGYVDGQVHTNGLENFWSLLKRALKART